MEVIKLKHKDNKNLINIHKKHPIYLIQSFNGKSLDIHLAIHTRKQFRIE